jgi:hypothetical protein
LEDAPHGFFVGGIATNTPNGVSRVEDETTFPQSLYSGPNVFCYFFLSHVPVLESRHKDTPFLMITARYGDINYSN